MPLFFLFFNMRMLENVKLYICGSRCVYTDRAGLGARDDAPGEGRSFSVGLGLTALQMDMQSVVPSEPLAEVPVLLAPLPLGLPWCRLGVF